MGVFFKRRIVLKEEIFYLEVFIMGLVDIFKIFM